MNFYNVFRLWKSFHVPIQIYRIMKVAILLITVALVQVSAATFGQRVSINMHNASLEKALLEIKQQTGYNMLYTLEILSKSKPISITVRNNDILKTLDQLFEGQPLEYVIKEHTVVVKEKTPSFLDRTVSVIQSAARDLFSAIDVSGLVFDEKGLPLAGVTVRVKGTNKATFTDNAGKFYLSGVDDDAVIEFRMVGYKVKELSAKNKFEEIQLEIASKELEEVVVAYGKTTQQALTGAVTVVKGEQIENLPNRSFDKSLQGLVPGLQITKGTGQPGGGMSSIILRGISSGGDPQSGSTVRNPLIVIDGIPVTQDNFQLSMTVSGTPVTNPIAQLNPSDIETISVLKDAAAIALYGSKASNGVILVTTKKGKQGKQTFSFRSQTDLSDVPQRLFSSVPTSEQYLQLLFETYKATSSTWTDASVKSDLLKKFPYIVSGTDSSFYPAPDWKNAIFRNGAKTYSNEISLSGGSEKGNYYLNFENTKQNGIVRNTDFDRKSFRMNLENKPLQWLTLGTNTFLSYSVQNVSDLNEGESTFGLVPTVSPLIPIKDKDGKYILTYKWGAPATAFPNPVAKLEYDIARNTSYRGLSKIYGEARFLKYFTLRSSLGVDFMFAGVKEKIDPRFRQGTSGVGVIKEGNTQRATLITNNILDFKLLKNSNHYIGGLIGHEAQIVTSKVLSGEARGDTTALSIYDQLTSPGYSVSSLYGSKTKQTLLSWFGQLNYGFKNRYFLSSSVRWDGSSRFGDRERWGNYWSVGTGWVVTEEAFLRKNNLLNYLKLRGSVGEAGNSEAVNPSTKFDILVQGSYDGRTAVVATPSPGNRDVKWEKTFSYDAGLDARLFNDRISLTLDMYIKKTNNLIYTINLPSISGFSYVSENIGDVNNKGLEVSISGDVIKLSAFRWNMGVTWSINKNILTKAYVPLITLTSGTLANEVGRNMNSFYLREWAGANPQDGKPQWIGINGLPTSNSSLARRSFVGKPQPDGYGGLTNNLSYRGLQLTAQFYYQYGSSFLNDKLRTLANDGSIPYINQSLSAFNYWKKPGDVSNNPRRMLNNTDSGNLISTRYLFDADYLKLSNVSLAYTFQHPILDKIKLRQLKVYVQGDNLAIWTKASDQDPDNANVTGGIGSPYPNQRTFSLGLQANF
ncbi:SusC/RagA family TonB-linked outer membrane protein [Pedobacter frigoris]|uniref:SusC/RagA family TonB-linked outer membrane protein n=1 Tax=Pedobacter frigoris TaxID=2571272 RepID=UPI002930FC4F|nr:SusC/RagA family TonB-linked outer membrane protein [Pedobacter frigoris]